MTGIEPETPPGQPITLFDERLVRMLHKSGKGWPVPALLAEIDRLRAIEVAAREFFEDEHECLHDDDPPCGLEKLRIALEAKVPA